MRKNKLVDTKYKFAIPDKPSVKKSNLSKLQENRFWLWFALINMALCITYMIAMHYIQQRTLNEVIRHMEQLEAMIKYDVEHELVEEQANVLEHCLDFSLTTDASSK
jgi:hypothetical protein